MKNDFPKLGGFSFLFGGKIVESGEGCESKKIKISVRRVRDTRARKRILESEDSIDFREQQKDSRKS